MVYFILDVEKCHTLRRIRYSFIVIWPFLSFMHQIDIWLGPQLFIVDLIQFNTTQLYIVYKQLWNFQLYNRNGQFPG